MRERTVFAVGKFAAAFCIAILLNGCGQGDYEMPDETPVVGFVPAVEKQIPVVSNLPGRVAAFVSADVRPQVDGVLQKRLFDEGSEVKEGQVLYQIDPTVYEAAVSAAEADLRQAQVNADRLEKQLARVKTLAKSKALSTQDLENTQSDYNQAQASVKKAASELETAKIRLTYTTIKAPVSGRIGASSVSEGSLVTAHQEQPLTVIRQIGKVYVDMNQPNLERLEMHRLKTSGNFKQAQTPKLELILEDGRPYQVNDGKGSKASGQLMFSEQAVDEATGNVKLRAEFENPDGLLLPGMYVKGQLVEGTRDALLVPHRCVLLGPSGKYYVYVLEKDASKGNAYTAKKRDVVLDGSWGNRYVIKSGLKAGELVVADGTHKVKPDETVEAEKIDLPPNPQAGEEG